MSKLVNRITFAFYFTLAFLVLVPAALADTPVHTSPVLVLQSKQLWTLIIGAMVPLVTYVVNHYAPWASEPIKAAVLVVVSAVAGGLYAALSTSNFGWNSATIQLVLTSVGAALAAHQFLWKPSGISAKLGAGTNATGHHLIWSTTPPADPPAKAAK